MKYVLDSSVAFKMLVVESDSDRAKGLGEVVEVAPAQDEALYLLSSPQGIFREWRLNGRSQ